MLHVCVKSIVDNFKEFWWKIKGAHVQMKKYVPPRKIHDIVHVLYYTSQSVWLKKIYHYEELVASL